MALQYIFTKRPDESYSISFIGGPIELNDTNSKLKLTLTEPLTGIYSIDNYTIDIETETSLNYIKKYFKYKNDQVWSDLLPLESITGDTISNLKACVSLDLEFYFIYVNDSNTVGKSIYLDNFIINGEYVLSTYDKEAELPNKGDNVMLSPSDTYKVFNLNDFQVISNHKNYDIQFRYTQTNGRTYSDYKPLTTENIQNSKMDPLRFVKFDYMITNNGDPLIVYDIILNGDFQNVSANYLKTNRYGLKEDCIKSFQGLPGQNQNALTGGLSTYNNVAANITTQNKANSDGYFKPYDFTKITPWANMLGNQVAAIAGWTVDYNLTDPDGNGIDRYVREYTLKNIVDYKQIKVIVPDNKFPLETIVMNQFNLDLFDTFEIHIMKDDFKNAFGITRRPGEDDIINFCETGNMFIVKHAQAFKSVMNASTYYKVILEKYEQRSNVRNLVQESKDKIDILTDNTTLDELFGESIKEENNNIANKEQFKPTSMEVYRHKISKKVIIYDENIIIDNFLTIKNYYDLSDKTIKDKTAIDYKKSDFKLGKGDNRAFTFWFNFNNLYKEDSYISQEMIDSYDIKGGIDFNFLDNYDSTNKKGYKITYKGNILYFNINNKVYKLKVDLLTNVWYGACINVDQSINEISFNVYKRNSELDILMYNTITHDNETLSSTDISGITNKLNDGYVKINNIESVFCSDIELVKSGSTIGYESEAFIINNKFKLLGSDIKYTNLRVMNDIIPDVRNFLLEEIVTNEYNLLLADNAHRFLTTTNFGSKNWK